MKFSEQEKRDIKGAVTEWHNEVMSFAWLIDRIEAIVSERITPEPKAMTEQEITNKEIYELECILEKVRKGGFMYTFAEAINDIENIFKPFMVQSAQITPEPGESGQSAEDELMRKVFYSSLKHTSDFPINNMKLFKELSFEMMTTYASQVCADKEREISLLKKELDRAKEEIEKSHMDKIYSIHDLKSELSAANESLTVMLRKNADLEKEIVDCKKSMLSAGMISGKDAEKFTKRHNISIENIDLRKIENGYDINNPKTK